MLNVLDIFSKVLTCLGHPKIQLVLMRLIVDYLIKFIQSIIQMIIHNESYYNEVDLEHAQPLGTLNFLTRKLLISNSESTGRTMSFSSR